MQLNIYLVGNKVIVPTMSRMQSGSNMATEPVASLDLSDPSLPQVIRVVLERGNPAIATPIAGSLPPKPVVLKYAGAKSWKKFVQIAELWHPTGDDGAYMLSRGRRDLNGAFWGGKEKLPIPPDATGTLPDANIVAATIVADTTARRGTGQN